jgi:hypothetical protein
MAFPLEGFANAKRLNEKPSNGITELKPMEIGSSMGAGAIMSPGKKIRALTATSAIMNKSVTMSGAIYWRKKAMAMEM